MTDGLLSAGNRKHPYLVFTSAGDHSNVRRWVVGRRNFDLWITYYGDRPGALSDVADLYNCRRGSKFQNLQYAYHTWPQLMHDYEAVFVMDDDILIGAEDINRLFELRAELDLWLLQPAFSPWGKVSHPITRVVRTARLRYTNFVENTCPLFREDKLRAFVEVYDPMLVGWGIDWWFLEVLGVNLENKVAVVDEIVCVNPHDVTKGGGQREIDRLQPAEKRKAAWETVKQKYGIRSEERGQAEYARVHKRLPGMLWGRVLMSVEWRVIRALAFGRRVMRKLSRVINQAIGRETVR